MKPKPKPIAKWTVTGNMFAAPTPTHTFMAADAVERERAVLALLDRGFERITIVVQP